VANSSVITRTIGKGLRNAGLWNFCVMDITVG
jgi:hypothetical protein